MWTINHGNCFVKLAKMPENNCFEKVVIKNLCGPMSSESWQEIQKGISDSDKLDITSLLNCWLGKQEVASSVTTGAFILFLFLLLY